MTEAQERLIYEWLRPRLKHERWLAEMMKDGRRYAMNGDSAIYLLPPLDYNTFMGEAVPRLLGEGVGVAYRKSPLDDRETLDFTLTGDDCADGSFEEAWACDADPWLALATYLEDK